MAYAVVLASLLAAHEPYAWPLDLPPVATSSFGEFRSGRLHMGIDLHTGKNGVPVHAPQNGYVARVRCSPYGYGKALYLHLKDGHTVVLGHLQGYREDIAAYVRGAQHAKKSYTVELVPEPNQFSFKRGERIAETGDSGIGPSHLHYEIRDGAERPLNPKTLGITWPDTRAPIIQKVLIAPKDAESRINGGVEPVVLKVQKTHADRYTTRPVRVKGAVGFGMDVVDLSTGGDKLGPYRVRLLQGEKECFRVQQDLLSYDTLHCGAVAYHPFLLDQGHFLLLWRWPGNRCESFLLSPEDGWVEVPEKKTEFTIEAEDDAGHHAIVTIPVVPDGGIAEPAVPVKPGRGQGRVECMGTFLAISAVFTQPEGEAPVFSVNEDTPKPLQRVSDKVFQAGLAPEKGGDYVLRLNHPRMEPFEKRVQVFLRGEPARTIPVGLAQLCIKTDSPFGVLFVWPEPAPKNSKPPVRVGSDICRIEPAGSPLDTPAEITFALPEDTPNAARMGLYRHTGTTWVYQETQREQNQLRVSTRNLGQFAVLDDDQAPVISNITPNHGARAENRRPRIAAIISDIGSGIRDIDVTCGGQWLLMTYDPERNHLEWERDQDLPSGRQELHFQVTDKAGNVTKQSRTLVVP